MTQHTPGPWTLKGPSSGKLIGFDDGGDYAILADGQIIAEVIHRTGRDVYQPAEANARLIAKAPEMYTLLRGVAAMRLEGFGHNADEYEARAQARILLAAIEKGE